MSTTTTKPSRWLAWKPKAHISQDSVKSEPTKPPKPSFGGSDGATFAESSEIEADPNPAELARASDVVNRAGVRIMTLDDGAAIGVWSDLDGPQVRAALRTLGADHLPVRYLDGAGVPMPYKVRHVAGEPVPISVLAEMERHPAEPWKVRDRMLNQMTEYAVRG
jgi:hypothetical protein